jgi:hypothetical protein
MARVFNFSRKQQHQEAQEAFQNGADGQPPEGTTALPSVQLPPLHIAQIAAEAVAVHQKQKTTDEGLKAVKEHHSNVSADAFAKISAGPMGQKFTMQMELATTKADITTREAAMASIVKGDEVSEDVPVKPSTGDRIQLFVTVAFTVGLCIFSVTTMHSFLESQAIAAGLMAWCTAIGIFCLSYVLEIPLMQTGQDQKKRLQYIYAGVVVFAAVVWVMTFGHEAAANSVDSLGDLNSGVGPADPHAALRLMVRGVSQVFMELCGGALLFDRIYVLLHQKGRRYVFRLRERWVHENAELGRIYKVAQDLEQGIAEIDTWFAAQQKAIDAYVTKAAGYFMTSLNSQQGG